MEKREPSLVPEWLRSTGNGSRSHVLSSSARSGLDSSLSNNNSKSRNPRTKTDVDSHRSPSNNARRGFSNGSPKSAYSNFNVQRSQRDKDGSREKDRLSSNIDPWDHDYLFPLGTFLNGRNREQQLRRSNSMTTRKQDDHLSQGFSMGFKNGLLPGTSPTPLGFGKDFPSLKTNGGGSDVARISSPALSQNLTAGEGWTSALAEVPTVIDKSASDSVAANVVTSNTITGQTRNMAETWLQPPRTGTPPQGSSKIQRVEDRTLKLIPVLPSTPKGSVLSSSDKSKTKPMARSGEIGLASLRNTHQHSSIRLGNLPSNSGSQIKPDTTKKMVVLKPAAKESASPRPINNTLAAASQMIAAPSALSTTSAQSTNNPRELKGALVNIPPEKKLSLPQTQSKSRSAFFSSLKKKTSTNISTSDCIISSVEENEDISKELVASDPSSVETDDIVMERVEKVSEADPSSVETDDIVMERVEKVSEAAERVSVFEPADLPDGEEAEFLKSLGWDENNTEVVEAITEEEIKAFYEENKEVKPSLMQTLPIIKEATEDATPNS
ncbi:Uncharacterized protein Rs2_09625 [Raphanus sativus]|uniref:Uncharacterized protein LOC108843952 n=1 Tax=Raphanus sativus TaxID=3726 RepID=A0A6J0ML28_RAPSA|nr:uncharacterized protein LOC108843952 [Raphanus sativus]XP_056862132.1 uncharacterized protein LOC130509870 [Raphanus sativus]KAJ4871521.1 Uncharacterized protein Rs2_46844 [Raphanus sativus]KAJ4905967.1 Uncharacterized protein Rs2_09625 [Raphanus sativus]